MSDTTNTKFDPPGLNWISYNSAILKASWTPAEESGNYFQVMLSKVDGENKFFNTTGCACDWFLEDAGIVIDLNSTYTVKVAQTDSTYSQVGEYSNEITLINAGPGNVSMEYNGTELKVSWDAKVGTLPLQGGSVSIFEKSKTELLQTYALDGSSGIIKPFPVLDSSLSYFITVAGVNPGSTGPASNPVDILQQSVQINRLKYIDGTLTAYASQAAVYPTTLTLFLYADGQLTEQSSPQAGGSVIHTVENSLELWQYNEVRLAFTNGSSMGPLSKPMAVIPGVPVIQSVYCDGAKIKAIWSNPPGQPVPTEGLILLFNGTELIDDVSAVGNSGTLVPKKGIDPCLSYDLRIASAYGPSTGTSSAPLAVISAVKQISSVDYDNGKITVSWPQGQLYGATGYLLSLVSNGSTIATQNAGDTKGCINYRLDPGSNYNILLQAVGNNTVGPSSNPAAVISAQVRVKQVTTLAESVYAELDNSGAPVGGSISGYRAFLYKDDEIVAGPVPASGTPLSVNFSYTLQSPDNYYVRAQATGSNSTGPLSRPVDVILGVPVIESIKCCDAANAYIQWSAVPEKSVTGYILTVNNITAKDTKTYSCISPYATIPVGSGQSYSITVQAAGNKALGLSSQSISFKTEVFDLISVYYNGSSITADWPASTVAGASYELLFSGDNAVIMTLPATTNHAVIPAFLSPNVSYSLQVRVVSGPFTGNPGSVFTVISTVPGIKSVTAESDKVTAVIDDASTTGKPGISSYQAFLYKGDALFDGPVTAAGSPLSAVFNKALEESYSYSVTVLAAGTNCTGPACEAMAVISGIPVIGSVDNDGNNAIVSWSTVSGSTVTGYNVVLTEKTGSTPPQPFITADSNITLTLDSTKSYSVKVQAIGNKAFGVFSQSIDILNEKLNINSVTYDGKFIHTSWAASALTGTGYELCLFNGNDLEEFCTAGINSAVVPAVLDPDSSYSLKVRTVNGIVRGPLGSALTVITAVPGIKSITAESDKVTAVIDDASTTGKPGISSYQAFLYKGDALFDGPVTAAGAPLSAVFNKALEESYSYSVTVQAAGTNCTGPACEAMAVISGIPVIGSVDNDGTNAIVSWSTVSGSAVTGYNVVLTEKTGSTPPQPFVTADSNITLTLDSTKSYSVKVQAIGNKAFGVFSQSIDILNEKLNINSVTYDGKFIHTSWAASAVTGTGYELCLFNGNDLEEYSTAAINSAVVPAVLDPDSSYSLKVRTVNGIVRGPLGSAFTVISAVPGIKSVTAESDKVTAVIDDASTTGKPGISSYQAFLYKGDSLFDGPITAAGSPLSAVFNKALEESYSYSVTVQAAGTNCTGPACEAMAVISGIPVIGSVDNDGTNAIVSWSTVSGSTVTGYNVVLTEKTGSTPPQPFVTADSNITLTLDSTKSYSVKVQAIGNKAFGVFSQSIDILNEVIIINNVSYDGEFVRASWAASAVTGTGYELCLFNGNDLEEYSTAGINSAVVPAVLDPDSSYSLKVRTVNGIVRGPLGSAFTVISAVPGIKSVTADSDKVTAVIDDASTTGKPGISSYQAFLYKGDSLFDGPVTAAGAPLSAVFNKALEESYSYSVTVQAAGTNCTGPACEAMAVISGIPVITDAYYDGYQVTASWSPVLSAGITGYLAILTSSASPDKSVCINTPNTSVCIPMDYSSATGTYSLCVRALNGISTGPCSASKDPIGAGFCLSANKDKAAAVLPMSGSLPQAPFEMVCYLPELYKTAPQTLPSSGPFILSALTGAGSFKYKITFSSDSMVWNFDTSPVRTSLLDSYQKFLISLEGKAPNQDPATIGILLPGAVQNVIDNIAGMMPQTFAETLYYNYGLLTQNNFTDLRPGMRLRLEYQQWQSVSSQPPQYVNGYVGNNIAEYDIGSYLNGSGNTSVGFNNFLSSLSSLTVPAPAASGSGPVEGGGGVIDFFFREFQRPFYRLIYPSTFKSSSNQGSSNPKDNALILAAADWFTLSDITQKIANGASIPAIGTNYALLYMRGRAAMTPLICISVNGTSIWVPVGTTLSQVLEQHGIKPFSIPASLTGLRYSRKSGNMYTNISEQAPKFITGLSLPVRFEWGNSVIYSNSSGWFNLPVLQGDQITFTGE